MTQTANYGIPLAGFACILVHEKTSLEHAGSLSSIYTMDPYFDTALKALWHLYGILTPLCCLALASPTTDILLHYFISAVAAKPQPQPPIKPKPQPQPASKPQPNSIGMSVVSMSVSMAIIALQQRACLPHGRIQA